MGNSWFPNPSFAENPTFPSTEISENKVATAANTNQAYPQRTTHWGMAGHVLRDPGYNIKVQHFWRKAGFFCKMSFKCPQIVKFLIKYANFSWSLTKYFNLLLDIECYQTWQTNYNREMWLESGNHGFSNFGWSSASLKRFFCNVGMKICIF